MAGDKKTVLIIEDNHLDLADISKVLEGKVVVLSVLSQLLLGPIFFSNPRKNRLSYRRCLCTG